MRRFISFTTTLLLIAITSGYGATVAQATAAHALIQGSGSSWAANAVNQWIADVHSNGLQIVFTANGSAQGRQDYASVTTDFAVSDIGYQGTDPATGGNDTSNGRPYAYLPVVAGGTSFPYQLKVGGQLVRNLRLSGQTLAKIFTNQITNWDDSEITADNNGRTFPNLPIVPVVHSEGSGDTYQFTRYLATDYNSIWKPFGGAAATEYFPRAGKQVATNGSDGVMSYISSGSANGAIGYDEYSYALGANFPVAKLENTAGYFTLPNQYNVAVALTKAQINTDPTSADYLLQNLDGVYIDNDPRVYPLSSYSYMIEPTSATDAKMTTAKRQTLADYLYYSICQGQKEMGPIGYSPLPVNLVEAGFSQIAKLHTADAGVDLTNEAVTTCDNPTFIPGNPNGNYLAQIAPQPPSCDKAGAGPCTIGTDVGLSNPVAGAAPTAKATSTVATASAGATTVGAGAAAGATAAASAGASIDPVTGKLVSGSPDAASAEGANLTPTSTTLAASQSSGVNYTLSALMALLLLGLLVIPPLVSRSLKRG